MLEPMPIDSARYMHLGVLSLVVNVVGLLLFGQRHARFLDGTGGRVPPPAGPRSGAAGGRAGGAMRARVRAARV